MIFKFWHNLLGMEKHDLAWHGADIADELMEYKQANGFIERWSETSDVVYAYTRAQWTGHSKLSFPLPRRYLTWGALYMFPKYTSRWFFFVVAGKLAKSQRIIREVRNPAKPSKLNKIAEKYNLNTERFNVACQKLSKYWIFLK